MRTSKRLGRDALTNDVAYNAYVALIEAVDEQRDQNGDKQIFDQNHNLRIAFVLVFNLALHDKNRIQFDSKRLMID